MVEADAVECARSALLADDVDRAVAALPPERRKAVEDHVIAGQPVRLVAKAEGKAVQTVRNYVARAKPVLSAALGSYRPPRARAMLAARGWATIWRRSGHGVRLLPRRLMNRTPRVDSRSS